MTKLLTAFLFLLLRTICPAQEVSYRISPQLTVSLPAIPDSSETNGIHVYSLHAGNLFYRISADRKEVKINSKEDYETALKGFFHAYQKKLTNCAIQKGDTIIGGVKGEFLHAINKDPSAEAGQLFIFYTVVDKHLHFISCVTTPDQPAMNDVHRLFRSARFRGENYPSEEEQGFPFLFGQILGYVLFFGVLILLYRLIRKLVKKMMQ